MAMLLVLCSFLYKFLPAWQVISFALFFLLVYLVYIYAKSEAKIIRRTCLPFTSEEIWQFLAQNEIKYSEMWENNELGNIISQGGVVGICQFSCNGNEKTPGGAYSYMHKRGSDSIILGRFDCERKI